MTTHIREETLQVVATEDLSAAAMRYKAVTYAGTIAADNKRPAGIMKYGANSGSAATIIVEGITKADVTGTVTTIGWPLKATTSGWLTAAASGDQVIGRALTAAASGDRVALTLDGKAPSAWGG